MTTTVIIDMREHDEAEAKLYDDYVKAERRLPFHLDTMHWIATIGLALTFTALVMQNRR
jgi:hypothetical protein